MKNWRWPDNVRSQPRKPAVSWDASREVWPVGQGRWFYHSTLLWWDPTWSPASSSGAVSTAKTWMCWSRSRGRPQKWSQGWIISPTRKGWESWSCSAWRREGSGEWPFNNCRGPIRKIRTDFLVRPVVRGQRVMVLN